MKLASLLLVAAVSARPEADPQLLAPLVPSLYHAAQNCTNQEDTVTLQSCVPVNTQECEDVEIPQQKIEVVKTCKVRICTYLYLCIGLYLCRPSLSNAVDWSQLRPRPSPLLMLRGRGARPRLTPSCSITPPPLPPSPPPWCPC